MEGTGGEVRRVDREVRREGGCFPTSRFCSVLHRVSSEMKYPTLNFLLSKILCCLQVPGPGEFHFLGVRGKQF